MDEILASIRRIIESSDEKPAAGLAVPAAKDAAGRSGAAQDTRGERPSTFSLPAQAARVVPFSEHGTAVATDPGPVPSAFAESEERWMPPAEPANAAGEPPEAEPMAQPATAESALLAVSEAVDPVIPSDRWAQELDDAGSWSVLADAAKASSGETHAAADATVEMSPRQPGPFDREASPEAEAVSVSSAVSEPPLGSVEPALVPQVDNEDDFVVDFDEAGFVEALDRNAALLSPRETTAEEPSEPAVLPDIGALPERRSAPAFATAREPAATASERSTPVSEPSVMQQASALMSEQAGIQVAAAFDDLSRAIREGQMKSMEEMAREMLRPMLQEWLDDNLPRLVERLVREEIERVSRGPRH